jgi:hypothetical protein
MACNHEQGICQPNESDCPDLRAAARALVEAVEQCHPQLIPCAPGSYAEYHISDPGYWDDIVAAARTLAAALGEG